MSLSTAHQRDPSDRQVERLRGWGERFGAWDAMNPFRTDCILSVVLLVLCLAVQARFDPDGPRAVTLQVALIVPLGWRRRAPEAVFGLVATVALVQWFVGRPLPADISLLVAVFTLAVHASVSRAVGAVVIVFVGVVMASVRWGFGGELAGDLSKSFVFLTGLLAASFSIGLALRVWGDHTRNLRERAERLEFERDQEVRLAAAAERARIAREMHDVVAHNVAIMVALADGAVAAAASHPEDSREAMVNVSTTGRAALADMRHLVGVLRADTEEGVQFAPQPGIDDLPLLVDGVRETGLAATLDVAGDPFPVSPGSELAIYRIVQESLTNVLKHADRPSLTTVTLRFCAPFVDVLVRDDGMGRGPVGGGHGLGGMNERAAMYGGAVVAGPSWQGGWEVTARVRGIEASA